MEVVIEAYEITANMYSGSKGREQGRAFTDLAS